MRRVINTKDRFFEYLPHVSPMRLKEDFGIPTWSQVNFRINIQKVISRAYDAVLQTRYMSRINAHDDRPEQFDESFYRELQRQVMTRLRQPESWHWLDNLVAGRQTSPSIFDSRMKLKIMASLGFQNDMSVADALNEQKAGTENGNGRPDAWGRRADARQDRTSEAVKTALIAMCCHDLGELSGEEFEILKDLK